MAFVQFTGVSLAFGARDILKDASLFLSAGTKAALAGPNGAGKTTLLRIVAGTLAPDSGERAIQKDTRVSYLPQSGIAYSGCSVSEEAEKAYAQIERLIEQRDGIGAELEGLTPESPKIAGLLNAYHELDESINGSGYFRRKDRIREVLTGLGFNPRQLDRPVGELSGGWQMRVALAKVLLENPDIMLLDEPTNYLDLEARNWLENFLCDFHGGFVLVSHDRSFLDSTVNEVYELWNGSLSRYQGGYTAYEAQRRQELESLFKAWEAQQEEIAHLEDFIRRFRYQATKASQVQSRVKQLEKIEPIIIPEGMKKVHFSFPSPPHAGRIALTLDNVSKNYGQARVVDKLSILVDSGSKTAFVGPNGAGKSTLMRIIAGVDTDFDGQLRYGTGISVAYFSQETSEALDSSLTVEEEAASQCPTALLPGIRTLLGAFLFRGDDVQKRVSVLSGGERSRLALLKLLLHPANLLVLDEPTNHLDLDSKDVLLDALKRFPGTVLFVSHDRFFIEGLADSVLELSCGSTPTLYPGNYDYYLHKKELSAQAGGQSPSPQGGQSPTDTKISREQDKKRKTERRRLKKREEELLALMDSCELRKKEAETAMADPANYSDGPAMKALQLALAKAASDTDAAMAEWEAVASELEQYADISDT